MPPQPGTFAGIAGYRDITRGYVDPLRLLQPTDPLLRDRLAGNEELYEKVFEDDQVQTCLLQRVGAVTGKEISFEPGDSRRISRRAAELLEEDFRLLDYDNLLQKMLLQGRFFGRSMAEAIWEPGDRWRWGDFPVRHYRRFGFMPDSEPRLLTYQDRYFEGEPLPAEKFWIVKGSGHWHDDEPYGLGLCHFLYWLVLFKRGDTEFWLKFLENFAAPVPIGYYPPGAGPEEKASLNYALQRIRNGASGTAPDGSRFELLEAKRGGTADYKGFAGYVDGQIAKLIIGQTMSSADGSSRSQAEVHLKVRDDILKADADLLCQSFNRGPARWWTDANFTGAAYPRLWIETTTPEDLNQRSERDERLHRIGYRLTPEAMTDIYGEGYEPIPTPAAVTPLPGGAGGGSAQPPADPAQNPQEPPAEFAAALTSQAPTLEAYIEQLRAAAGAEVDGMVQQIREALDNATDLADFAETILGLFPSLNSDGLANLMEQALTATRLAGTEEALDLEGRNGAS